MNGPADLVGRQDNKFGELLSLVMALEQMKREEDWKQKSWANTLQTQQDDRSYRNKQAEIENRRAESYDKWATRPQAEPRVADDPAGIREARILMETNPGRFKTLDEAYSFSKGWDRPTQSGGDTSGADKRAQISAQLNILKDLYTERKGRLDEIRKNLYGGDPDPKSLAEIEALSRQMKGIEAVRQSATNHILSDEEWGQVQAITNPQAGNTANAFGGMIAGRSPVGTPQGQPATVAPTPAVGQVDAGLPQGKYPEGTKAKNKRTGETYVYRGGEWKKLDGKTK